MYVLPLLSSVVLLLWYLGDKYRWKGDLSSSSDIGLNESGITIPSKLVGNN